MNTDLIGKPEIPAVIVRQIDAILKSQTWVENKYNGVVGQNKISTLEISKLFLYGMYIHHPDKISFDCTNRFQKPRHILITIPSSIGVYPDDLDAIGRCIVDQIMKAVWEEIDRYTKSSKVILGVSCPVTNLELKTNTKENCSFMVSLRYRSYDTNQI